VDNYDGGEGVEVFEIKFTNWALTTGFPKAYLQREQLISLDEKEKLRAAAAALSSSSSSSSALSPTKGSKNTHWTNRLYRVSKLYKNANVLRSYQLDGLNWILR
jgi:RNA polymerase-interacting CarD/CdnL/TRCF family regulator